MAMIDEMINRAARAICAYDQGDTEWWDEFGDEGHHGDYRSRARAAIAALAEAGYVIMPHKTNSENQSTINLWQDQNFPNATEEGILNHLREEFEEFYTSTGSSGTTQEASEEAADLVILLFAWAYKRHIDLMKMVDQKMAKNRLRVWDIQPDGTGRHK